MKGKSSFVAAMDRKGSASEARHVADQEFRFRVEARRNRLLAHWAAERLGKAGAEVETYLMELIEADMRAPGPETVLRKLHDDFAANGLEIGTAEIARLVGEFEAEARRQMEAAVR